MQIAHNDFQDQLVRGLAHRMNNILSLFHGYLSLLVENENLDPATLDGLAMIKRAPPRPRSSWTAPRHWCDPPPASSAKSIWAITCGSFAPGSSNSADR